MKTKRKPRAVSVPKVSAVKPLAKPKKVVGTQNVTLIRAEGEDCFWVNNGPVISDIKELAHALKTNSITDQQWKHHVGMTNNDFANWIQFIFRNPELARKFRLATSKSDAYKVLSTALTK